MGRCPNCKSISNCVSGQGPSPTQVMLIGEAPGQVEDRLGRPFCGPTGQELDNLYLKLAGLNRADVYVTNAVKCRPVQNRKPSMDEVRSCATYHLPSEIAQVHPQIIILCGATACSLIKGCQVDVEHGIQGR